jgi:hypothetical protein
LDYKFWQKIFALNRHYILADICSLCTLHFGRWCLLFTDTICFQKIFALYGYYILADIVALYWHYIFAEFLLFMDTTFCQKMFALNGHCILAEDIYTLWTLKFGRRCLFFMVTAFWRTIFALYGHCILADVCSLWTLHLQMFAIYGHYIFARDVCSLWTLHFGRCFVTQLCSNAGISFWRIYGLWQFAVSWEVLQSLSKSRLRHFRSNTFKSVTVETFSTEIALSLSSPGPSVSLLVYYPTLTFSLLLASDNRIPNRPLCHLQQHPEFIPPFITAVSVWSGKTLNNSKDWKTSEYTFLPAIIS